MRPCRGCGQPVQNSFSWCICCEPRPVFTQSKLDEMMEAARKFDVRAHVSFLAFRRPTIEEEWCQRILHSDPCEKISMMFYPGIKCYACISELREHDQGDEDPCR